MECCVICTQTLISPEFEWVFYSCGHFACPQCYSSCSQTCRCTSGFYLPNLSIGGNEELRNWVCWCLTARQEDPMNYRPCVEQLKSFISQTFLCPGCNVYISPFAPCPHCPADWICIKCQAYSSGLSWECTNCGMYTNLDLVPDDFPLDELPEDNKGEPSGDLGGNQAKSGVWKCEKCTYEYNLENKCLKCPNLKNPPRVEPNQPASLPSQEPPHTKPRKHGDKSSSDVKKVNEEAKVSPPQSIKPEPKVDEKPKPAALDDHSISNEEKRKAAKEPAPVQSPKRSSGVSEWMCVCGRKNQSFVTLCVICSQPKLAVKPPEEAKVEPVGEPWDCPSCTFKGIRGLKCQICGAPRPQPRSRPQPAAADIPASDLKVKCTACGAKGQQACTCSQVATVPPSISAQSTNLNLGEKGNSLKVKPASKAGSHHSTGKVVPAKANSSGSQWKCEKCEYPSNMFGATRCFKCKARKAE